MQRAMDDQEREYKMLAGLDLEKEGRFKQISILDYYIHLETIHLTSKKEETANKKQ